MVNLILDVETTGLPLKSARRYPYYKDSKSYDTSRVISVSWIITSSKNRVLEKHYYVIKPIDFRISRESTTIHGITRRDAMDTGILFTEAVAHLRKSLANHPCKVIVAHNIFFDFNILLSEFYRIRAHDMITAFYSMERFCTMMNGKKKLGLSKFPKLVDLYLTLTGTKLENAHNALADAEGCSMCFTALLDMSSSS